MSTLAAGIETGKVSKERRREALTFYLTVSPWVLGFVLFTLGPMLASAWYSFNKWNFISPPEFIGLSNYGQAFGDPLFVKSLVNTAYFSLGSVPLELAFGLLVALVMNNNLKGINAFRSIYYLPAVMSGVAVVLLWRWVFDPKYGMLNQVLALIGIKGPTWIYSPQWVIPAFIVMTLWGVGGYMVLYLAGLQGVPTELYEAANIDGAGRLRRLFNITLPMISPVIFFNLVMGIIGSFQVFTSSYIMTAGGPANASLFYVLYLYRQAFQYFNAGYGSALAWILFIVIMGMTALVFRGSALWVYYEGSARN
ncbi:MAG: carbohydrate ABC transporter permease [Anaerolineae bacterium]